MRATSYGCFGLTSVTISNSVTSIGNYAFEYCKIRSLKCAAATPPKAGDNSFSVQTQYHTTLYVPNGTWDAYAYDNQWYRFINIREESTSASKVKAEEVYTLMNSKKMSYLVYDATNDKIAEVASVVNIDESNLNHAWMFVEIEGQSYVYNIGVRKYLQSTASGYTLTATATPISAKDGEDGIFLGPSTEEWSFVKNEHLQADDVLTPVIDVNIDQSQYSNPVYDLQGRRLTTPQHGINIIGGKKVMR